MEDARLVDQPEHHARGTHAAALGILVLALVLCLVEIGSKPLWFDEAFSVNTAVKPWRSILGLFGTTEFNMTLYYALLHAWSKIGTDEATVRLLSTIFAVGAVGMTYLLGRALFGSKVGLVGSLLLGVNAFVIQYAQEARSYALLLFLAAFSTLLLVRALRSPSRSGWLAYALVGAAIPYAQLLGPTIWCVHALAIATYRPRVPLRLLVLPAAVFTAALVPVTWDLISTGAGGITWVPSPTIRLVLESWMSLAGSGVPRGTITVAAACLGGAMGLLVIAGAAGSLPWSPGPRWGTGLMVTWLVLPIALILAASLLKPAFVVRYLILVEPALVLLAALGLLRIPWRRIRAASMVLVLVLAAIGMYGWYREAPKPDWRGASAWVLARSQAVDRSIMVGDWGASLEYYAAQSGKRSRVPLRLWRLDAASPAFPTALASVAADLARLDHGLWVFTIGERPPDPTTDPRFASLGPLFQVTDRASFGMIDVTLFTPRPAAGP